jgi:hypothetical protein
VQVDLCLRLITATESENEIADLQRRVRHAEQQIPELARKEELAVAALKVAQGTLDTSKKRAFQGEVLCQDAEEDLIKLEAQIKEAQDDIVALEKQERVVREQIELMLQGGGLSCWPKPTMHPLCPLNDDVVTHIQVRPCGFCKQWYHCSDIVVTSCKHTFHPFCLAASLRNSNVCSTCGQILHPDWWTSFGFRAQDDDIQARSTALKLDEVHDAMIQSLRASAAAASPPCKVPKLHL